jgi:hypothetical protein
MVNVDLFQKFHPNYPWLIMKRIEIHNIFGRSVEGQSITCVKSNGIGPGEMADDDFLTCSPIMLGFSLVNKTWGK